ncbi:hypothetical protein GCM10009555_011620 [Acrocarpospora macrocephala]|uniref:Uncharacterized protein n=1 Tax=Acrocarpospora macrocephala TaxID=150177 RepID=A0A5M3WRP8_9ACTN|nr:hypothetical protein Amac_048770 [Acrocarpospora macrocephala]
MTISLGNTVGNSDDVKSLLPLLLERLVRGSDLDESIVLGKLVREGWRSWPTVEQEAISGYLTAVWRSLLTKYPPRIGSFRDAADFLGVIDELAESVAPFLSLWEGTSGPEADRHLADLVVGWVSGSHLPDAVLTWLHCDSTRNRLYGAFELHHDTPWADDFARAYDYLA